MNPQNEPQDEKEKTYSPPEITHELELETRAGSALSNPIDTLDWLDD